MSKKVAVLLTVFNRKEKTLACLANLFAAMDKVEGNVDFDVFLTDDKSTDGTRETLEEMYPSVNVLAGDGNLFWCRGMIRAWEAALRKDDYDAFIWLNNDSFVYPDGLDTLFKAAEESGENAIIGGAFISELTGKTSYGGKINYKLIDPNGRLQEFCQLNGNLIYVPKAVFDKIGLLDATYHHSLGDTDYGYRAAKQGIKLYLTPEYVGTCDRNDHTPLFCNAGYPLRKRLNYLYSPLGPSPVTRFKFNIRHFSLFKAVKSYVSTHLMCFFPLIFKIRFPE